MLWTAGAPISFPSGLIGVPIAANIGAQSSRTST